MQAVKSGEPSVIVSEIKDSVGSALRTPTQIFSAVFTERVVSRSFSLRNATVTGISLGARGLPSDIHHITRSRTDSDAAVVNRVYNLVEGDYRAAVGSAADLLCDMAERSQWEPESLSNSLLAVKKDVERHSKDIADALLETSRLLKLPSSYTQLLGAVAMLENDLRLVINEDLKDHLVEIGMRQRLEELQRT